MSREKTLTTPSLVQLFDAPEEYRGSFGWICGYSADAAFLNEAAGRFTRSTTTQRAHEGKIMLALMLDPANSQISLTDVPGVLHMGLRPAATRRFRFLHAKVALLAFRHEGNSADWRLRLIVSTGNWTRQTLEDSIDLAWCIDLDRGQIAVPDGDVRLRCADLVAAWSMLSDMSAQFNTDLLKIDEGAGRVTAEAAEDLENCIDKCREARGNKIYPRFFDNRKASLLNQLPGMVERAACGIKRRNYLAMGSGFYEGVGNPKQPPGVLMQIRTALQHARLLTQAPEIDVFVNEKSCQAIGQAECAKACNSAGFLLRPAGQPARIFGKSSSRSLHAKFIFSANHRDRSNVCSSSWLYMGSGNLTTPGFVNPMSPSGGNLEAGVVFSPGELYWEDGKKAEPHLVVSNRLPVQWQDRSAPGQLASGEPMPEAEDEYLAPPITRLQWESGGDAGGVLRDPDGHQNFSVLDTQDKPCSKGADGSFSWPGERPREVVVRWSGSTREPLRARVPVIDDMGRLAATPWRRLDIDEAWWQLASFPQPPDVDDLDDPFGDEGGRGQNEGDGNGSQSIGGRSFGIAEYPVRLMMGVIENIADRQTMLDERDWLSWCNRLQQVLVQASGSPVVDYFVKLGLNPLSALRSPPFRPEFAETGRSGAGALYERTLETIEQSWGVAELPSIGGLK